MILKKYKILRNTIIISAISVAVSHFYFSEKKGPANQLPTSQKNINENGIEYKVSQSNQPEGLSHSEKAVIVLEKNSEDVNATPVYKVLLPKGKRLYDEEKMNEYAQDANIETIDLEDTNI